MKVKYTPATTNNIVSGINYVSLNPKGVAEKTIVTDTADKIV